MDTASSGILHIFLIGFHHQKGSTLEYCYPALPSTDLPPVWKSLPYLALPDGCHNYNEDSVFFVLPMCSTQHVVYGVACCRQVETRDLCRVSDDITRSTVQKSVCVLSHFPLFGYIEAKLKLITHAYFNGGDFSNISLLQQAFESLNLSVTPESSVKQLFHVGLDQKDLVLKFHHHLLQIVKALLLRKRVLVYGAPANGVCVAVLGIVSLLPNSFEWLLKNGSSFERDEYGFPLAIFPDVYSFKPYVCLQQMDMLSCASPPGFLAGVVNPLFEKQRKTLCDVFVDMNSGSIDVVDPDLKSILQMTTADLRFCGLLEESVTGVTGHDTGWQGSNEWVLAQFKLYILSLLASCASKPSVEVLNDFNSDFMVAWLSSPVYADWFENLKSRRRSEMAELIHPEHICASSAGLSMADLKRKVVAQASDYGLNIQSKEQVLHALNRTATHVSETVSGIWSSASSAMYSWWTSKEQEQD